MHVTIDRGLCDTNLEYCQRCSAAFIKFPEGVDRLCILDVVEDGKESLTLKMYTDDRVLEVDLTDEERELASVEGWEVLADFDPALFSTGSMERWQELSRMPKVEHVAA